MSEEDNKRLIEHRGALHVALVVTSAILLAASVFRNATWERATREIERAVGIHQRLVHDQAWLHQHAATKVAEWTSSHPEPPGRRVPPRFALRYELAGETIQSLPLVT